MEAKEPAAMGSRVAQTVPASEVGGKLFSGWV
jgi:hypothetical protein